MSERFDNLRASIRYDQVTRLAQTIQTQGFFREGAVLAPSHACRKSVLKLLVDGSTSRPTK